jgi:hypothetical protein
MIDVRMRNHDHFHFESVTGENIHDAGNVITRIDDDSFSGRFIANDGTVAGEKAHRQDLVNHCIQLSRWHHGE